MMPIDPASQGTWVAANDAGLAMTLLNFNPHEPPTDRKVSRGGVIPLLIACDSLDAAITQCVEIDSRSMMPFRLVMCDGSHIAVWRSDQPSSEIAAEPVGELPLFFTSSGLGDHLVEQARRRVFSEWFSPARDAWSQEQDALHQHHWPQRPHLSICMQREDARTVSYTTIDVSPARVSMSYHPDRPDRPARSVTAELARRVSA